ncbi:MAG: hypothetical protein PQJ60_11835 [Spirochaetales bacterium]|nr:hypothetical protein [Spirochaetales bacterium]
MKKGIIRARLFLCLPLLLSSLPLAAQNNAPEAPKNDPFRIVRDRLRDGSSPEAALTELESLNGASLTYDGSPTLFLVEYDRLKGIILTEANREEEARTAFVRSMERAEGERQKGESSRNLYYLGATGFLLARLDGPGAIISRSSEISATLDRAYERDRTDREILYQKAASLAYAPRLFGGNPSAAIELLEKALSPPPEEKYLRFDLLSLLSYSYEKIKNNDKALAAAEQALLLYPNNPLLRERVENLKRKTR